MQSSLQTFNAMNVWEIRKSFKCCAGLAAVSSWPLRSGHQHFATLALSPVHLACRDPPEVATLGRCFRAEESLKAKLPWEKHGGRPRLGGFPGAREPVQNPHTHLQGHARVCSHTREQGHRDASKPRIRTRARGYWWSASQFLPTRRPHRSSRAPSAMKATGSPWGSGPGGGWVLPSLACSSLTQQRKRRWPQPPNDRKRHGGPLGQ